MSECGVVFGERVVLLHRGVPVPVVPQRALLPGVGKSVWDRARSAQPRPEPVARSGAGRTRRTGGRTILTAPVAAQELIVPGRPDRVTRVRWEWLGVDPAPVDIGTAHRLGLFGSRTRLQTHEVLSDWSYWHHRVEQLAETNPGSELAALLEERPSWVDEPTGQDVPTGLGSWKAQRRLDSLAARQKLINALQGEQYADAAALAVEYPKNQEFLSAEVSLSLGVPESVAGELLTTGFTLATKLPRTLDALRAGRVNRDAAQVIVGATAVVIDPVLAGAVEQAVLPMVSGKSRESVRRLVCGQVIRLDPGAADARHVEARKQRTVTRWADVDGMGWLKVHAPVEAIASVWEALTGLADTAKTPGDERTMGQRRVDAMTSVFAAILDHGGWDGELLPTQHGRRPHVGVLVPHDVIEKAQDQAARSGGAGDACDADRPAEAQPDAAAGVCEIVGYGPVARVQGLRAAAEGTWRRLLCDPLSGTLLDYGRNRYEPPDSLKQFVVTRDQTCGFPGCGQPAWRGQLDHAQPYSRGGPTAEANLSALCQHHHRAKDGGGFTLRINPDRSKTWTSPLGRSATNPRRVLMQPKLQSDQPAPY